MRDGTPQQKAEQILSDPRRALKGHLDFLGDVAHKRIANICGSNGRKAIPLALLGAHVTVFDISEENREYAIQLARAAEVKIEYIVCDVLDIDLRVHEERYDILYLEGGILHYFDDLSKFFAVLYTILAPGGKLVLNDFHPYRKCGLHSGDYFDKQLHTGAVAYKGFFDADEQSEFPDCLLRYYTVSEIINAVVQAGFVLRRFDEYPGVDDRRLPGELMILAFK